MPIYIAVCRLPPDGHRAHRCLRSMAHALKHHCLANHLSCDPQSLVFSQDDNGKPLLQWPSGWHFNLSHSRDTAVVALAPCAVGVDVEYAQRKAQWARIGQRLFHPDEQRRLQDLPETVRHSAMVQLWTAKEAWAKATGLGIARLEQAPPLHWRDGCWCLAKGAGDVLHQAQLGADMLASVYLPNTTTATLQWQVLTWQGADNFEPATEPAVTILSL